MTTRELPPTWNLDTEQTVLEIAAWQAFAAWQGDAVRWARGDCSADVLLASLSAHHLCNLRVMIHKSLVDFERVAAHVGDADRLALAKTALEGRAEELVAEFLDLARGKRGA